MTSFRKGMMMSSKSRYKKKNSSEWLETVKGLDAYESYSRKKEVKDQVWKQTKDKQIEVGIKTVEAKLEQQVNKAVVASLETKIQRAQYSRVLIKLGEDRGMKQPAANAGPDAWKAYFQRVEDSLAF